MADPGTPLSYPRFTAVMTTLLVVAATILTINEGRRIALLAVVVAAAGIVLLAFTPVGRTRAWRYGVAALVAVVAVAGSVWWLSQDPGHGTPTAQTVTVTATPTPVSTPTPTTTPTPTPTPTPTVTPLVAVASPASGDEVGHCILFSGTFTDLPKDSEIVAGIIEPDNDLWYVDRGMQRHEEHGWRLHAQFGDTSDRRRRKEEVVVGIIPKAAAEDLVQVNRDPPDVVPYWFTPGPPEAMHVVARFPVWMTPARGDCA